MICNGCIYHNCIAERGQDYCAVHDDPVDALRACLKADYYSACLDRLDKSGVRVLVDKLKKSEQERLEALSCLEKVEGYIVTLRELLSVAEVTK